MERGKFYLFYSFLYLLLLLLCFHLNSRFLFFIVSFSFEFVFYIQSAESIEPVHLCGHNNRPTSNSSQQPRSKRTDSCISNTVKTSFFLFILELVDDICIIPCFFFFYYYYYLKEKQLRLLSYFYHSPFLLNGAALP